MKLARSVAIGIIFYFVLTTAFILGVRAFKLQIVSEFNVGVFFWGIALLTTALLLIFLTSFYFRDPTIAVNWQEGLQFGTVLLCISAILDATAIITLYLLSSGTTNIISYYFSPFLWLTVIVVLVTPPVVAHTMLGE